MMRITFEILKKDNAILIDSIDENFESFSIDLSRYWNWVKVNGLNTYCEDYYDPSESDGHGQRSGSQTFDEYFSLNPKLIEEDIVTYLINIHKLKF